MASFDFSILQQFVNTQLPFCTASFTYISASFSDCLSGNTVTPPVFKILFVPSVESTIFPPPIPCLVQVCWRHQWKQSLLILKTSKKSSIAIIRFCSRHHSQMRNAWDSPWCRRTRLGYYTGHNKSIIPTVYNSSSLSIELDTDQSTNIRSWRNYILRFVVIIEFWLNFHIRVWFPILNQKHLQCCWSL